MGSNHTRRDERCSHPPVMDLTERDITVLQAVAQMRILRQDQLQLLFFGSRSTAQYRLFRLYQHSFLDRVFLPVRTGSSPTLYTLGPSGAAVLRATLGEDVTLVPRSFDEAGHEYLAHTLAINDVRIAISLASTRLGYKLATWKDEAAMKVAYDRVDIRDSSGKQDRVSLIPDSYFVVETPQGKAHFFLEIDRGTMTVKRFQTKIRAYLAYMVSGAYERRYKTRSLRILTVTSSAKRATSLKQAAEDVHRGRLFWFTTLPETTPDAVLTDPIWQIAGQATPATLIAPMQVT